MITLKKAWKIILVVILVVVRLTVVPLIQFAALFFMPFPIAYIAGEVQRYQIRSEVFEYVLENKAELEQGISFGYAHFVYATAGLAPTASSEYGYFYSTSHTYGRHCYKYKTGYRMDNYLNDEADWYYEEQICENWFYYEIHDG